MMRRASVCAATCLRLEIVADPDAGLTDAHIERLTAEVQREVGANASEFVRLSKPDSGESAGCRGRMLPGVSGEPMSVGPYSSVVRITSMAVIRMPASSITRQSRVQHGVTADTNLTFEEYEEPLTGTVSGWVTVKDSRAGGLATPLPIQVSGQVTARWQRNPMSAITTEDRLTGRRATSVQVDLSGRGKAQADDERRQARAQLAEKLIFDFAKKASRLVLSIVDAEPAVPDPAELAADEPP
jgi:hypothetical protein